MIGPSYYDLVMEREQAAYAEWSRMPKGTAEAAAQWTESFRLWQIAKRLGVTIGNSATPIKYYAHLLG